MPYPTITERYGSLSATGLARETTFGTPVAASSFLPMTGNTLEQDPGWFSPELMMATRDRNVFNLYGEQKNAGALDGPLFPSNAMELIVSSIGADAAPGAGVTGTAGAGSTTLSSPSGIGATTISVASSTGFTVTQVIQIYANSPTGPTTAECRKITAISGSGPYTLTLDTALAYAHASAAAVAGVVAPYTHTISQANLLPSLTVEKNLGDYQSLQFAGARVNKLSVKAPVGNEPVSVTADMIAQSAAILTTPTAPAIVPELPFVFAEASVTLFSHARAEATNCQVDIENGIKETYTYSGQHGPSFLTPVSLHGAGTLDLVWSSLNDATYGDFQSMANGTLGALSLSFTHPGSGGYSVSFSFPQVALSKYANDVKFADVIMSSLSWEASKQLTDGYTVQATVVNGTYTAY